MVTSRERLIRSVESMFRHHGTDAMYFDRINPEKPVRVIPRRPEEYFEIGEQRVHAENAVFDFRISEIATPNRGDEIYLEGKNYQIVEEPQLELHQLIWRAETIRVNN